MDVGAGVGGLVTVGFGVGFGVAAGVVVLDSLKHGKPNGGNGRPIPLHPRPGNALAMRGESWAATGGMSQRAGGTGGEQRR